MKNMNPIFSLKNFRSFGEDGADFELAPITVLTGCNSAGKSSLVKALKLLAKQPVGDTLEGFSGKRKLPYMYLKASSKDLMLGGYNRVVHSMSQDGKIEFSYSIWSSFLHEEVVCRRIYRVKKAVLNDGMLSRFSIEKKDGTIFYGGLPCRDSVVFNDGEVGDVDGIYEEEHFDAIRKNYERFVAAYGYSYYVSLKKKLDDRDRPVKDKEDDFYNRLVAKIEEGKKELEKVGMTIEEADEYDIDAISQWHEAKSYDDDSMIVRAYKEDLNDDERQDLLQQTYYTCVINEIVSPWFISRLATIDSSTNKISRVYNVDDHDKLSALLCDIVNRSSTYKYRSSAFVNDWLKKFEIGDCVEIEGTEDSYGVRIFIKNNEERRLLADEGCGLTQIISVLLQIDTMKNRYSKLSVSSDFKEITEYGKSIISIEEPEVHLHPKYQSMLADLFVDAYQKFNIRYIIETHSEYLIRNLQVMVADKDNILSSNDVSLNYVEKDKNGVSSNRKIEILEDGRLSEPFGPGFFDESKSLVMKMLKF